MKSVKLSLFQENPENPQTVTAEAFADLKRSIERDPERLKLRPIAFVRDYRTADGRTLAGCIVIDGNKRLRALKSIYGEGGIVPASWFYDMTDASDEERRRWLVRANIQSGEWDADALAALYSPDELADITTDEELLKLADAAELPSGGETDPDDVPEVNDDEPPASVRGKVYLLGEHRLMCGDSTSEADVAQLVQGGGYGRVAD